MKNIRIAQAYLDDARIIFDEAKESLQKGHFHRTVRKCQESVELALKALLRMKGIEYPKAHKIGKVLVETLKTDMDVVLLQKAADISDQLAIDREPSFYGSEDASAESLYEKDDAENALSGAGFIFSLVKGLVPQSPRSGDDCGTDS